MKQRLGIAQALLNEPKLLVCDEPTSALDPAGRKDILDILSIAGKRTTVIFSTHILSDAERICNSVGILNNGTLALQGSIAQIKSRYRKDIIRIELSDRNRQSELVEIMKSLHYINEGFSFLYKKRIFRAMAYL